MSYSDADEELLELLDDSPRAAIKAFLEQLDAWVRFIEEDAPGWIGRELDQEHNFRASLDAVRIALRKCYLPQKIQIDRFVFRAERICGRFLAGKFGELWNELSTRFYFSDEQDQADRFLECMAYLEERTDALLDGRICLDEAVSEPLGARPDDAHQIAHQCAGRKAGVRCPGSPSLRHLQRWWPFIRRQIQDRSFVPAKSIGNFCLALEDSAQAMKAEGLAAKHQSEKNPFNNFRRRDRDQSLDGILEVVGPVIGIRSAIDRCDLAALDDDEVLEELFDALLAAQLIAKPNKRGTRSHVLQSERSRQSMRKLAPKLWFPGIHRAAWARRIAENGVMQRVSKRHGAKRGSSMSWKTIEGYLAEDFDLSTCRKLYQVSSES